MQDLREITQKQNTLVGNLSTMAQCLLLEGRAEEGLILTIAVEALGSYYRALYTTDEVETA